jgi:two-component system, OmpR family, alkaline phosphatase synthesis response regulator PhoP
MIFNFFRRNKSQAPAVAESFPFFVSKKELEGSKALPLLNEVEAELLRLQQLTEQQSLSAEEQSRYTELQQQHRELLGSGQVNASLATHLLVSEQVEQSDLADEWVRPTSTAHVLLVEDDRDLSEMLSFCLHRITTRVTVLHDGNDALQWIAQHAPVDLISLDLMLPRKDGLQLLRHIRTQPGWEKVPILVMSSKSDESTVQTVLNAGANVYLTKPIQPDAYLAQVEKLMAVS